ncbi:cupin domain-containing protein [Naasia sp. SYSU D00057]|uniref:cupin domain-containing protein n=1 Tax=Naasia sp. SYSU D00057 TaxID=2817380 RepID=UPI001FF04B3F|nr:cupin domain-containing protein [Naasia sp. SYSU D00057]
MSTTDTQRPRIFRPDELPANDRGNGARTIPLVTAARGGTTYLNGITEFGPGSSIAHHTHNVAESVMVIEGDAMVDIDGVETRLRTFDTTFVPANIPHHFTNASATASMRIFWTYGSLDATRTIVSTGKHGRVDDEKASRDHEVKPVREIAQFDVLPGHGADFEEAVRTAVPLFQAARGSRTLTLEKSEEQPQRYTLLVGWETVEDHMVHFRESDAFLEWRALIGPHLAAPPQVEHVRNVLTGF